MRPDTVILDSRMSQDRALLQNPDSPAPLEILHDLAVLPVSYRGYDDCVHMGQIVVTVSVAEDVHNFFLLAATLAFPIEKVIPISDERYAWNDERSCEDNNSSGYNYRVILGTNRLSKHAYGAAFDINPRQNIYCRYDASGNEVYRSPRGGIYNPQVPGTLTAEHPLVVFMRERGWVWGGDWTREHDQVIDYQHFEKEI